jgi:hypothetical protein
MDRTAQAGRRGVSGSAGEKTHSTRVRLVPGLVGLVVSGFVYLLLSRSLDVTAEQAAIDASERELRAIDVLAGGAA